jgi:hypothetical protein
MEDIYGEMITVSRNIAASFPLPCFYTCCGHWMRLSRCLFSQDGRILRCRGIVRRELKNNYGHGLNHAEKVAVDAGALAQLEGSRRALQGSVRSRAEILAQMAGLLHDLRRGEKDHAHCSAMAAEKVLREFPFPREDKRVIVEAIANHEAFVEPQRIDSLLGQMVSDVLYDADKFRWGPDNFTFTLWEMVRFSHVPLVRLVRRFPKGMKGIARIKDTFRTEAGKKYGPEFIDLGLEIGEKIYQFLQVRFAAELSRENGETRG